MRIFVLLLMLISSVANAQYTLKGEMLPAHKDDWIILYKIDKGQEKFIANTTIKSDTLLKKGKKNVVGVFKFDIPKDSPSGMYRITYKMKKGPFDGKPEQGGYLDFFFNKENISMVFHPDYPEQSVIYKVSKENKIYADFFKEVNPYQRALDSLQVVALNTPDKLDVLDYKKAFDGVTPVQQDYLKKSNKMLVYEFIKASQRKNPKYPIYEIDKYFKFIKSNFFHFMDFNNEDLTNSSFLYDRISYYILNLGYSRDSKKQLEIYKNAINEVMTKIQDRSFKKNFIEFMVHQFTVREKGVMADYLLNNYYYKLDKSYQDSAFITRALDNLRAEVGRIAPDFSWKSEGKNYKLSELDDADQYVLVFWSKKCPHCLRDIPKFHEASKKLKNVKVIGFAIEDNDDKWEEYKESLNGWYNVLGLGRWDNPVVKDYKIYGTPTYFILDKNKKIIDKPYSLKELKKYYNIE